jgi:DNA-binding XRE family transcriptional regulator
MGMHKKELATIRQKLAKTQREMAQLLGISLKAIQSFEQGWRQVPVHIERQVLFLLAMKSTSGPSKKTCWSMLKCPPKVRKACPAHEFKVGNLCWFINGTICQGTVQKDWQEKMEACRQCPVFQALMAEGSHLLEQDNSTSEAR